MSHNTTTQGAPSSQASPEDVPQWAIDAASEFHAAMDCSGWIENGEDSHLCDCSERLATIIARHAPDNLAYAEREAYETQEREIMAKNARIAELEAENARLREAIDHIAIDTQDTIAALGLPSNDSRLWALKETIQSALKILS